MVTIRSPLTRRDFVWQTGAFATLAALLPGSRRVLAAEPDSNATTGRLKIGLLGASHSHALSKAKVLKASPDYQLVGACEESPDVREQLQTLGIPLLTQGELLERAEVVAVESDNEGHAGHAKTVLRAGKHLHLEKPPTDTLSAFRELQTLAQQKGRLLQMGYMWRYHPGLNACLEAARQGWLGEIYQVRATIDTTTTPESRLRWARFRGGVFFELGCHLVDPLIRLLGRPDKVRGNFQRLGPDRLADNTQVTFQFPRALGMVSSAARQPRAQAHRTFEILGTNGRAVVKPLEPPTLEFDLHRAAGPYPAGAHAVPLPRYERYAPELTDLAAAIRDKRALSITPAEDLLVHESFLRACDLD